MLYKIVEMQPVVLDFFNEMFGVVRAPVSDYDDLDIFIILPQDGFDTPVDEKLSPIESAYANGDKWILFVEHVLVFWRFFIFMKFCIKGIGYINAGMQRVDSVRNIEADFHYLANGRNFADKI